MQCALHVLDNNHCMSATSSCPLSSISVLIRTYNSAKTLPDLLKRLALSSGDEIIVVDSGSTDATLEIASSAGARVVHTKRPFNFSRSLNDGFTKASNPWVFVISSHCIPPDSSIMTVVRRYADSAPANLSVAYGRAVLDITSEKIGKDAIGGLKEWKGGMFYGRGNGIALYRRSAWQAYEFDETLETAEDLDWLAWAMNHGSLAGIIGNAQVLYRNNGSFRHMFNKGWRDTIYGLNAGYGTPTRLFGAILSLGIASAHLLKLTICGKMPFSNAIRLVSHALGACLASFIYRKKGVPISPSEADSN